MPVKFIRQLARIVKEKIELSQVVFSSTRHYHTYSIIGQMLAYD